MSSFESDNESLKSTTAETSPMAGLCQAFHPLDNDDKVTVLTFQLPSALIPALMATEEEEKAAVKPVVKEHFFDICLDVSGSMAGAAINCAKEAMKRLVNHLIDNCGVPAERITIYLYAHTCRVRRLGGPDDIAWMGSISAGGGKKETIRGLQRKKEAARESGGRGSGGRGCRNQRKAKNALPLQTDRV